MATLLESHIKANQCEKTIADYEKATSDMDWLAENTELYNAVINKPKNLPRILRSYIVGDDNILVGQFADLYEKQFDLILPLFKNNFTECPSHTYKPS